MHRDRTLVLLIGVLVVVGACGESAQHGDGGVDAKTQIADGPSGAVDARAAGAVDARAGTPDARPDAAPKPPPDAKVLVELSEGANTDYGFSRYSVQSL